MAKLTICGAGIFGLTIGWEALKRGAEVTIIDPNGPGAGSSGGIVGALQPHTPDPWNEKKEFQFQSLIKARTFWAEVDETSSLSSGYASVGRLMALASDRELELAKARALAAEQNWRGLAEWTVVDRPESGWCPLSPTGSYLYDNLSAILNPHRAVASLAAAITAKGGTITTEGSKDGTVIWATGWQGLLELSAKLDKPAGNGVKGQAVLLDYNAAQEPQIYAEGLHIIPHLDGTVAVGSTSERDFENPSETDEQLDLLHEKAVSVLPQLKDAAVLKRWAGVRPRASSRAPLLGPHPGRCGHFIANGGFKIGFGMAPKCADVLLDLILEDTDDIPASFHTNTLA